VEILNILLTFQPNSSEQAPMNENNAELLYEEIDRQQARDNFLLKKGKNGRRTIIFFSSIGLFLDDLQDVKRIVESDAYEWMNISEGMDCNLIFVRDLKKS